jgi:succinate dehydrogenase hydrophobic anchor subunit
MRYVTAVIGAFIVLIGICLVGMLGIGSLYMLLRPALGDRLWEVVSSIMALAVLTLAIYGAWRSYSATVRQFEMDADNSSRRPPDASPPTKA